MHIPSSLRFIYPRLWAYLSWFRSDVGSPGSAIKVVQCVWNGCCFCSKHLPDLLFACIYQRFIQLILWLDQSCLGAFECHTDAVIQNFGPGHKGKEGSRKEEVVAVDDAVYLMAHLRDSWSWPGNCQPHRFLREGDSRLSCRGHQI